MSTSELSNTSGYDNYVPRGRIDIHELLNPVIEAEESITDETEKTSNAPSTRQAEKINILVNGGSTTAIPFHPVELGLKSGDVVVISKAKKNRRIIKKNATNLPHRNQYDVDKERLFERIFHMRVNPQANTPQEKDS